MLRERLSQKLKANLGEKIYTEGYYHRGYADSLASLGSPIALPRSGGWLFERAIPRSLDKDLVGTYPFLCCRDWEALGEDVSSLDQYVSVVAVTDPFGQFEVSKIRSLFPDYCFEYKQHFVTDLRKRQTDYVSRHHLRYARIAQRELFVQRLKMPSEYGEEWVRLYSMLIKKHNIQGVANFDSRSLVRQLKVPGLVAFAASYRDEVVGMVLWYVIGKRAYYHLGAYSEDGYKRSAAFGIFQQSIKYFQEEGLEWLGLGAGAGVNSNGESGLDRFKKGWSTSSVPVYLCGRILQPDIYVALSAESNSGNFFPAYRSG